MIARRPEFPGMDPWLEGGTFWPDVHNSLLIAIRDELAPMVDPRYFVGVEERVVFWSGEDLDAVAEADVAAGLYDPGPALAPGPITVTAREAESDVRVLDVRTPAAGPVTELYLEVRDVESRSIVTVIEGLSPTNKLHSQGRRDYLRKRGRLLRSRTSLVEVDLMRAGRPMPLQSRAPSDDYRILVSRAHRRPRATLFLFSYRAAIPAIPIPLRPGEEEPRIELTRLLHNLIDRVFYFRRIDYHKRPSPPLRPADADWAAGIIARAEHLAENGA